MSIDGSFRDARTPQDQAWSDRAQAEALFAPVRPAVTVRVKKRRLPPAAADVAVGAAVDAAVIPAVPAGDWPVVLGSRDVDAAPEAMAPRVHRLEQPRSAHAEGATAPAWSAESGWSQPADDVPAPAMRRTRARRDPARKPGAVHIVVQAPPVRAQPQPQSQDLPAWQRILCFEPEAVPYAAVLQALDDVDAVLDDAYQTSQFRVATPSV